MIFTGMIGAGFAAAGPADIRLALSARPLPRVGGQAGMTPK